MIVRPALTLLLRGALVVVVVGTATLGLLSLCREPLQALVEPLLHGGVPMLARLSFQQVLVGGCALAMVGCALWLVGATGLAVASQVARVVPLGRRQSYRLDALVDRVCPVLVRTLVVTALGAVVTTAATSPAPADTRADAPADIPGNGSPDQSSSGAAALSGLALPDRIVAVPTGLRASRTVAGRKPRTVVVSRGDSLWSLTVALLPESAGDGRICAGWHRLYRANKRRIGADPDLIVPGTALVVPRSIAPRREDHS